MSDFKQDDISINVDVHLVCNWVIRSSAERMKCGAQRTRNKSSYRFLNGVERGRKGGAGKVITS